MRVCASILLISVASALAQSPSVPVEINQLARNLHARGSHLIHIYTDSDGDSVYYAVPTTRLSDTPEWNGQGEPPIDLTDALQLARQHLERKHPEMSTYSLTRGELFIIDHSRFLNRWCYKLEFRVETKTAHHIDKAFLEAILTSVEGLITPEQTTLKRTRYTTFFVIVMFDGRLIEEEVLVQEDVANKPSERTR